MTFIDLPSPKTARVGDLEVAFLERGQGPLVLCYHGFPDTPCSFAYQLGAFAEAGYRVVAPYLRGYPPTSTPDGPYQAAALGRDLLGLMDALGEETARVYGHDWGTAAVYAAALDAPSRITHLVASAVPYGPGMPSALIGNADQQRRSWYMFFFQTRLAELALPLDDYAFIDRLWSDWSPGFRPPPRVLGAVKDCLRQPEGLDRALAYYRTTFDPSRKSADLWDLENRVGSDPITVPSLYVHGARDGCIGLEVSDGMDSMFTGGFSRLVLEGAGHFTHLEAPEAFNAAVLDFFG